MAVLLQTRFYTACPNFRRSALLGVALDFQYESEREADEPVSFRPAPLASQSVTGSLRSLQLSRETKKGRPKAA